MAKIFIESKPTGVPTENNLGELIIYDHFNNNVGVRSAHPNLRKRNIDWNDCNGFQRMIFRVRMLITTLGFALLTPTYEKNDVGWDEFNESQRMDVNGKTKGK